MSRDKSKEMRKSELAEFLQVAIDDLFIWTQSWAFADWLGPCPQDRDKVHDDDDIVIFTLINQRNKQIDKSIPIHERVRLIEQELLSLPPAMLIKERRRIERSRPEVVRWERVSTHGVCLKYQYEWLKPLQSSIDSIAVFGCWTSDVTIPSSESYALLWTLKAMKVVVIDKEPGYIRNAQSWLSTAREQYPYFKDYPLEFSVGDMTDRNLILALDTLDEEAFDLSYCQDVLYNMYSSPQALQTAINTMTKLVKPGGWVIAIEPKMGVDYERMPNQLFPVPLIPVPLNECKDVSKYFEAAGLVRSDLSGAPECSYCYQKPRR